jgi:hypothetical protein
MVPRCTRANARILELDVCRLRVCALESPRPLCVAAECRDAVLVLDCRRDHQSLSDRKSARGNINLISAVNLDGRIDLSRALGGRGADTHGEHTLERGDLVRFAPGPVGAREIMNRSGQPARTLLFSSSRAPAVSVYPDSDTIGVWAGDGENDLVSGEAPQFRGRMEKMGGSGRAESPSARVTTHGLGRRVDLASVGHVSHGLCGLKSRRAFVIEVGPRTVSRSEEWEWGEQAAGC